MSFPRLDKVEVSALARLCRGLKKNRAWEIIWMHPENNIVHETRSMPVYWFICFGGIAVTILVFCDIFHAEDESKMLCIRKMLRSASVVKMNTGRWRWSESNPHPPWDAVQKCPLWSAEEWKAARRALSKLVPTVDVELTDDKVVVLGNMGTEATNEDGTGTKILIAPVIQGRGVPATFAARPCATVCSIPCRLCSH